MSGVIAADDPRRDDVRALLERHLADYCESPNSTFMALVLDAEPDPDPEPEPEPD